MNTLLLDGDAVSSMLTPELAISAVEAAFRAHGSGATLMPPKVYLPLTQQRGDFRAMPVYMDGLAGVKWVNAHPENPKRHGIPSVVGVFILSDAETALPLCILDATAMTAMRTGAAAAVAAKHLARTSARSLGIVGCGVQARTVIACVRSVLRLEEILLADREPAAADELAAELGGDRVHTVGVDVAAAADVVCTLTPSHRPIVPRTAVREGAHINAMGADAPGKQELDERILADARVLVDDWKQASESGEINVALAGGRLRRDQIAGSLGEVVAGRVRGRTTDEEITVFDSTGLAVQDLAVARLVYERARADGVGTSFELIRP